MNNVIAIQLCTIIIGIGCSADQTVFLIIIPLISEINMIFKISGDQ